MNGIRGMMSHSEWIVWAIDNLDFDICSAQRYMRLAKAIEKGSNPFHSALLEEDDLSSFLSIDGVLRDI